MATGAPGTNGVWQYGEDDSEATFSALLNKAASTTDTQLGLDRARLTTLEARKLSGLVPVIPTSVTTGSGSGSHNTTTGLVTFTNASSVSINGCFTSAYANYRIILEVPTAGATSALNFRLRASGADNASSSYGQFWTMSRITGAIQSNNGTGSVFQFGSVIALSNRFVEAAFDVINPNAAKTTDWNGQGIFYDASGSYLNSFAGIFDAATVFDGFTVYVTGTTITGTLKVYGYN